MNCSFCGKPEEGRRKLFGGPGAYICVYCVEVAATVFSLEPVGDGIYRALQGCSTAYDTLALAANRVVDTFDDVVRPPTQFGFGGRERCHRDAIEELRDALPKNVHQKRASQPGKGENMTNAVAEKKTRKVYVASKFENKEAVREAQQALRQMGFEITYDWTPSSIEGMSEGQAHVHQTVQSLKDADGVRDADVLFFLGHAGMKGAFVELGIAIGCGMPSKFHAPAKKLAIVVEREKCDNVFFHLNEYIDYVFVATLSEGIAAAETWLAVKTATASAAE